ncbi:MAG: class B sortase [Clostridia bacterium]|nr:class B sortase [Clostridia bacterium]
MRKRKRRRRGQYAPSRRTVFTLWCLTVLFIGCTAFGAYSFASAMTNYEFGNAHYEELRAVANVTPRPTPSPTPDPGVVPILLAAPEPEAAVTPTPTPKPTATPKPIDFAALKEINSDIIAWIRLPGTSIDYPIVQTNNNSYYLSHLFDGSSNQLGTLFMDYENKGGFSDQHILIYGHAMQDGSMFGSLENYASAAYYKSHPEAMIYLPDGSSYRLVIFAAARLAAFRSLLPVSFESDEDFLRYIEDVRAVSAFSTGLSVSANDHVVSLCTCVSDSTDYRFIVSGKLVPVA